MSIYKWKRWTKLPGQQISNNRNGIRNDARSRNSWTQDRRKSIGFYQMPSLHLLRWSCGFYSSVCWYGTSHCLMCICSTMPACQVQPHVLWVNQLPNIIWESVGKCFLEGFCFYVRQECQSLVHCHCCVSIYLCF